MERHAGMDLFDFISKYGPLSEQFAKNVFAKVLDSVIQCFEALVVHGDIKDENIIVDVKTGHVNIVDFGSGLQLQLGDYIQNYGTREYSSPEWIRDRR